MHIVFDLKFAVLVEGQQVHGRKITGRIVKEHVFGTRVGPTDRAVFWACVPSVDGVVVLDARIGTSPRRVTNLFPQIAGFDDFVDFAVLTINEVPVRIHFNGLQKGVRHTDGVVGVLARDRIISFGIPVSVVCREFDRCVTLLCIIQHTLDVCFWNGDLFSFAHGFFQLWVYLWIVCVGFCAVPPFDRIKDQVQFRFVHLGTSDDGRNFLLLQHLPVDEFFDIWVIRIHDDHLGRTTCCSARFDRTSSAVTNFQETHQAR